MEPANKNWWTLREDLTAAQRKHLDKEWDTKGFSPGLEKLLLKVTKGNKDKNGVPDFSKTTLCDIVSLNVDEFGGLLSTIVDATYTRQDDEFIHSDYQIRGWNAFRDKLDRIQEAFDMAFGDALMGGSKSVVINIFRDMHSCSNKGDWAKHAGGTVYRGKKISWEQFKKMPWRLSENEVLKCTATYQSKLAMQSWTIDPKVALNFSRTQGAQSHYDLHVPEIFRGPDGEFSGYGKDIAGFLPVVIEANVPTKDCFLNPYMIGRLQMKIGHAGLREKEVLRISTEPIKAKFTVTKSMLRTVVENEDQVKHIFDIIKKRK